MSDPANLLVFRLDERRYALSLAVVERIVRAVEVTHLPGAPEIVFGAIDVEGRVLPVLNIRRRFHLPEREISPDDHFLIAHTLRCPVVLVIDEAVGVIEHLPAEVVSATNIAPGLEQIRGVIKLGDGMVLIQDLDKFLSLDEARIIEEIMREEVAGGS